MSFFHSSLLVRRMWLLLARQLWLRYATIFHSPLAVVLILICKQAIVKGFTDTGFKAQSQPLSAFQESYGLEADEDEDEEMEDVEEEGESEEDEDEDDE